MCHLGYWDWERFFGGTWLCFLKPRIPALDHQGAPEAYNRVPWGPGNPRALG